MQGCFHEDHACLRDPKWACECPCTCTRQFLSCQVRLCVERSVEWRYVKIAQEHNYKKNFEMNSGVHLFRGPRRKLRCAIVVCPILLCFLLLEIVRKRAKERECDALGQLLPARR
jgi:hypothetical protein